MSHHRQTSCRIMPSAIYPVLVLCENCQPQKQRRIQLCTDWNEVAEPPEKAINTTICGVISLRAFTFNFCATRLVVLCFGSVCATNVVWTFEAHACDLNSTQFTCFSQVQHTHRLQPSRLRTSHRQHCTLIWILSAPILCVDVKWKARTCANA